MLSVLYDDFEDSVGWWHYQLADVVYYFLDEVGVAKVDAVVVAVICYAYCVFFDGDMCYEARTYYLSFVFNMVVGYECGWYMQR